MNILLAGFQDTRFITEGVDFLRKNGLNCWQNEDADEVIQLMEQVVFDVIVLHLSLAPLGLQFRSRSPSRHNRDTVTRLATMSTFLKFVNQYAKTHKTRLVSAWIHEKWPTAAGGGGSGPFWADSMVNPESAIEIITTIQRVLQQYPGVDPAYQRFFRASWNLHAEIAENNFSFDVATIQKVLGGTDILFNQDLIRFSSAPAFPLALTSWSRQEETFYYCIPLQNSNIPIVMTKLLPFIENAEWGLVDSQAP